MMHCYPKIIPPENLTKHITVAYAMLVLTEIVMRMFMFLICYFIKINGNDTLLSKELMNIPSMYLIKNIKIPATNRDIRLHLQTESGVCRKPHSDY